jgi:predicted nucleotidyltransferase
LIQILRVNRWNAENQELVAAKPREINRWEYWQNRSMPRKAVSADADIAFKA